MDIVKNFMDQQFKPPFKRCRTEDTTAATVLEVCTQLDNFLDALERLLGQLELEEVPTEGLGDLELGGEDSRIL